jgi:sialic acid synthase SpsE
MLAASEPIFLNIGDRKIGDGYPCFFIAEIGSNHNQDFDLARRMIDSAAIAGADAVKFQTFRAADHYSKKTPGFSYLKNADTYELIRSLELDRSWQSDLKLHAEEQGVVFLSSPCDSDAINSLIALDVPAFKVASFDLTDDRLISEMAASRKPLILSTGMATWMDIQIAIDAAHKMQNKQLVLLQCTSLYPAPPSLSNLRAMATMRAAFGTLVGYSDHTIGDYMAMAAVAMGACIIEKHFTIDRNLPGPDHSFAIEPHELTEMIRKLREIEEGFGDGIKNGPRLEEHEMAEKGRRSLHASCAISAGQIITHDMLVAKRPGLGIPLFFREQVAGRIARRAIEADEWITWDMV